MTPKKSIKAVTTSPKPSTSSDVKSRTRAKSATTNTPSPIVELAAAKPTIKRHVSASARKSTKAVVVESTPASDIMLDRSIATDEVALRAYHIWMERGCPEGTSTEDWLIAETQLRSMSAHA